LIPFLARTANKNKDNGHTNNEQGMIRRRETEMSSGEEEEEKPHLPLKLDRKSSLARYPRKKRCQNSVYVLAVDLQHIQSHSSKLHCPRQELQTHCHNSISLSLLLIDLRLQRIESHSIKTPMSRATDSKSHRKNTFTERSRQESAQQQRGGGGESRAVPGKDLVRNPRSSSEEEE